MAGETIFVFALIGVAGALMASNRVRFDVVALLVVLALMLSGVLTVNESLSGFGSSVVVLVAGLLVVGEMLARTGVATAVGDWILRKGGTNETRLLILIMVAAGLLGAVMSSTAIVAIFIPIVLRVAARTNLDASRMLLPMSYAALISGMLTLIATTPNLVVHEELKAAGHDGFGFFSFSLVGVVVLAVAVGYMLTLGQRLLSGAISEAAAGPRSRTVRELLDYFGVRDVPERYEIDPESPLVGKTIGETEIGSRYRVRIIGLVRGSRHKEERIIAAPDRDTELRSGDALLLMGTSEDVGRLQAEQGLTCHPLTESDRQKWFWELGAGPVLVHPDSTFIGKSLRETKFRSSHNLNVVALHRGQEPVDDFLDAPLRSSDNLLVAGPWKNIRQLQSQTHEFVVLEMPAEYADIVPSYRRMPVALAILAAMVLLTIFDVVPLIAAVLLAALAAGFTGCLSMSDAYRSIHWSSLVLIAGMLPLADALNKTGGTQIIVDALMSAVGDASPYMMLTVIFFLTALLGLVLSNTASAVLVAPIAIYMASVLDISPYPFAVAVLIAASAAYSTPISTPVVTLVVEPGRYKFGDFVKVGVPLLFLTYLVTLIVAPLIFPFHAP